MRAFIGLPLPEDVRGALARLQRELADSGADVKWVVPDSLHITLKFLDEISGAQRQAIEELLTRIVRGEPPWMVRLDRVGAFPSMQAPRVIWVGLVEGQETLRRLAETIERDGAAIPLRKEARPFSAHLTLGRVRSSRRLQALAQRLRETPWQGPPPWRVTSIVLYQSVLTPAGPTYSVLAEIPLRGGE